MTEFKGIIGRTLAESEPYFVEAPHPGDDAPNVVIVLMDDTGFAQFGCYGSDIDTANVDALATMLQPQTRKLKCMWPQHMSKASIF